MALISEQLIKFVDLEESALECIITYRNGEPTSSEIYAQYVVPTYLLNGQCI